MPRRNTLTSTRPTRASWLPARQPRSSVMTWTQREVRRLNPVSPRRSKRRGAYEADDRNSFLGDGGGNCLGAESRRHRKHAEYDEGGPAEEGDGYRCRLVVFTRNRSQAQRQPGFAGGSQSRSDADETQGPSGLQDFGQAGSDQGEGPGWAQEITAPAANRG